MCWECCRIILQSLVYLFQKHLGVFSWTLYWISVNRVKERKFKMWQVIWASCWLCGLLLAWRHYARNLRRAMENVNKGPAHQYIWFCFWSQLSLKCISMVPIVLIILWSINVNYYVNIHTPPIKTLGVSFLNPLFEDPFV